MYHCKLHIVIMNQEPILEKVVRAVKPLERFEHEISAGNHQNDSKGGDIVFFDLSEGCPAQLRRRYGGHARLILCAEHGEAEAMGEEELLAVNEVWEKPLEERLTALRFQRILEGIRQDKELRLANTYLDAAIDTIPDMIWFKSKEGLHLKINQAFCHTVGKPREDITGKDHCYIWDVSREEFELGEFVCKDTDDFVLRTGTPCQSDEKVKSQHGMRQFKTYKSPLFDEDGTVMGTVGIGHDVTDLENMGTEMEILLRSMPYAILVRNEEGKIINVNPIFEKYFNVHREDILGKLYPAWASRAFDNSSFVNSEGYEEATVLSSDRTLEIHEEPIHDVFQNIAGSLSIYRDVTVERALEKQILFNSNTDFMTGLYNRRYFYQYIAKNRKDQPISLLYLDLDHFKKVNDTYGHKAGDDALVLTAKILKESFSNEFITRFGGDEFLIVILGACDLNDLKCRAERLLKRMKTAFENAEHLRILSASIGIAQTTDPDMDIDILIQQSDSALYEAKQQGRARCSVYSQ